MRKILWIKIISICLGISSFAFAQSKPNKAFKEIREEAEKGNAESQFELAVCYLEGTKVLQNQPEGIMWLKKAAELGVPMAQCYLGVIYMDGKGVAEDQAEAFKWFSKAADQGDAVGQYCLGEAYKRGIGTRPNPAEAVLWIRKAADQKLVEAQFQLGMAYSQGEGVEKDIDEAARWYRLARHNKALENASTVEEKARLQELYDTEEANAQRLAELLKTQSDAQTGERTSNDGSEIIEKMLLDAENQRREAREKRDSERLKRIEDDLFLRDFERGR